MNKIIYAAPVLAALAFSNVASAAGSNGYTFTIPSFYTDLTGVMSDFTALAGAVSTLATDAATPYEAAQSDYNYYISLYQPIFETCASNPTECTYSSQASTAAAALSQIKTDITTLPPSAALVTEVNGVNTSLSTTEKTTLTAVQTSLNTINTGLSSAQTVAEEIINNASPAMKAAIQKKLAAVPPRGTK